MDFNEAHSHARQMGNRARAFDKIEEVLAVAATAEQAAREADAKRVILEGEIAELSTKKGELKVEAEALAEALQEAHAKVKEFQAGLAEDQNQHVLDLAVAREKADSLHDAQVTALEDDVKAKRAGAQDELDALGEAKDAAEKELNTLTEQVRTFQGQIAGIKSD